QRRVEEFAPGFRCSPLGHDAGWLAPQVAAATGLAMPELVNPDLSLAVPAGEGEWLALGRAGSTREAIRRHSARDAAAWPGFTARVAKHAGFLSALYGAAPPDLDASGLGEWLPLLGLARKLRGLGRVDMLELLRGMPMAVQELLDDGFESPALKAGLGALGVRGLRQGPRSGGTAFGLLHRQVGAPVGGLGSWGYWKSGPDALAEALGAAARKRGVDIRAGARVRRILVRDDQVTGVALEQGDELGAPLVFSSADPAGTLLGMVDP